MDFNFGDIENEDKDTQPIEQNALCVPIPVSALSLRVGPRQWMYGRSLIRGMLSVLGGTGGVGKTRYAMKVALSLAMGRSLLGATGDGHRNRIYLPQGAKVWYITLEDPQDDIERNLMAEALEHPRDEWEHNFFISSGRDTPLKVVQIVDGQLVRLPIEPIVNNIIASGIDVAIVDPFANSFDGIENDADTMKIVMDQWRLIAHRADVAVWLLHHFRKGGIAGDAESFRGSIAIQNNARVMETLTTMSQEDAETFNIDEKERRGYVRLDNAKANLSAASSDAQWFHMRGVSLNNGDAFYPDGDEVGVLNRWHQSRPVLVWDQVESCLNQIDVGSYSSNPKSNDRNVLPVIVTWTRYTKQQASELLGRWIVAKVLIREKVKISGRDGEKLIVSHERKMAWKQTDFD
jgi:hypothetical protein